jgi:CrcB protein
MGFCGAFTTWSAFMLDVDKDLVFRRRTALNIILTFGLSIAAVAAGFALAS